MPAGATHAMQRLGEGDAVTAAAATAAGLGKPQPFKPFALPNVSVSSRSSPAAAVVAPARMTRPHGWRTHCRMACSSASSSCSVLAHVLVDVS